jgi:hypothetical protein
MLLQQKRHFTKDGASTETNAEYSADKLFLSRTSRSHSCKLLSLLNVLDQKITKIESIGSKGVWNVR